MSAERGTAAAPRQSRIERNTKETQIVLTLNLDGTGASKVETGIPFFNHMLEAWSKHALMDLHVDAKGDLDVDLHHTVEDVGICLGRALREAVGDKNCGALIALAAVGLLMAPLAAAMVERRERHSHAFEQSAREALREALGHRGYVLLTIGFFVCGFQVVFVGVHLPAYLLDKGLPAHVGVTALALIGLFNIFGTYTTGWLGAKVPKRYILTFIYFARSVVIGLFIWLPLSAWSVYAFAIALGLLWLSTVPPTNGIVGQVFGVRYMAMLTGVTFFSHQIGSFLGAWLGGFLFDRLGSYDLVWYLSIGLGVVAGLINLPIDEREIRRAPAAEHTA